MGAICSSEDVSRPSVPRKSRTTENLDKRLLQVIKALSTKKVHKQHTFMALLLKFPKIQAGFNKVKDVFRLVDKDSDGMITMPEMLEGLKKIGFQDGDDSLIKDVFESSDFDQSESIQPKEFIVVLAVLFILKEGKGLPMVDREIIDTFQVVIDTFLFFDKRHSGILRKKDVMDGMKETSTHTHAHQPSGDNANVMSETVKKRFEELDWDHSGQIEFKEFMFALEGWVLDDAEESRRG